MTVRFVKPILTALICLTGSQLAQASVCLANQYPHGCAGTAQPRAFCAAAVQDDATDVNARLALCQAHVNANELAEAAIVLQRGLELCSQRQCSALNLALSNVRELRFKAEQQSNPADVKRIAEAQRSYCLGPMATERTIDACEQLIASNPDDAELHFALGEKLQKREQPARAIASLRKAQLQMGATPALSNSLQAAEQQRALMLNTCLQDGTLADCDAALLPDAPDEYAVQRQRGRLLAEVGRYEQALRALLTARALRAEDPQTARAIAALDHRKFAGAETEVLSAQVDAFRTLKDTAGERTARARLQALQPTVAEQIIVGGAAEPVARPVDTAAVVTAKPPGATTAIVTGKPPAATAAVVTAKPPEATAAPARVAAASEPQQEIVAAAAGTGSRTFSNALMAGGRTH